MVKESSTPDPLPDKDLMERLQEVQQDKGYIPERSVVEIGKEFDIPLSRIYGIITFYSFFKLKKGAKNKIHVCNGTACHVQGAEKLAKKVSETLGVGEDQVTEDGKFSYEIVRCLGMCASAPIIRINDEIYPKVKEEDIESMLDEHRE